MWSGWSRVESNEHRHAASRRRHRHGRFVGSHFVAHAKREAAARPAAADRENAAVMYSRFSMYRLIAEVMFAPAVLKMLDVVYA